MHGLNVLWLVEAGRKQKVGLNLQLHRMVVEIVLGLVHIPPDALAITDAHQNPEWAQDARTRDVPSKFVHLDWFDSLD